MEVPSASVGVNTLPAVLPVRALGAGDVSPALPAAAGVETLPAVLPVRALGAGDGSPVLPVEAAVSAVSAERPVSDESFVGATSLRPALPERAGGADEGSLALPALPGVTAVASVPTTFGVNSASAAPTSSTSPSEEPLGVTPESGVSAKSEQ